MEPSLSIRSYLTGNSLVLRKEGHFTDCCLISSGNRYLSHRVLLAHFSTWFSDYFRSHPESPIDVPLPFDDSNVIADILTFFYEGTVTFTLKSLPVFLKAASVYGIANLRLAADDSLRHHFTTRTLGHFTPALVSYNLLTELCQFSDLLATHFKNLMSPTASAGGEFQDSDPSRRLSFYRDISPPVLHAILSHKILNLKRRDCVRYIDEFTGDNTNLDLPSRALLESLVDSQSPDFFTVLSHYKCNWLTPATMRRLLNEMLTVRRADQAAFESEQARAASQIGRWYLMSWMSAIESGRPCSSTPEVDIVRFVSTLGNTVFPLNPHPFGLIHVSATAPLGDSFRPENVLAMDGYYLSCHSTGPDHDPYISLYFGDHSRFVITHVHLDASITRKTGQKRTYPKKVKLEVNTGAGPMEGPVVPEIEFETRAGGNEGTASADLAVRVPCCKVTLSMIGQAATGGRMFRLKTVEFRGYFHCA
jgi:hypothetical protein